MKARILAVSAVSAVSAAVALTAAALTAAGQPSQREKWNAPGDAFKIIDHVYYVGTGGLAAYLFKTKAGLILLDGALPESVPMIEENIGKLGFKVADIKILLNSHAHYDHSGGLQRLKRDSGAKLYAMEGDVSALEGGFYLGSEDDEALSAPPVKVDRILKAGETVELGGVRLTAHLTPGHTRGCTSWGETVHEGGKSYHLLVFCSATVAANRITAPLQYPGIVEDYRKTFAKAKSMNVDVFLAPHPEFADLMGKHAKQAADPKGPNPFVNPTEFKRFIEKAEADFEKTLADRSKATP